MKISHILVRKAALKTKIKLLVNFLIAVWAVNAPVMYLHFYALLKLLKKIVLFNKN